MGLNFVRQVEQFDIVEMGCKIVTKHVTMDLLFQMRVTLLLVHGKHVRPLLTVGDRCLFVQMVIVVHDTAEMALFLWVNNVNKIATVVRMEMGIPVMDVIVLLLDDEAVEIQYAVIILQNLANSVMMEMTLILDKVAQL